ncbi:lipase family protein [Nesterenkonia marinintestina]|uniref:lipase family protein n=1 Tax=Nesterenkonia marinintestina TaxID=2979865 RepID=UPI0021C219AC|nr:lipase family protein [Nesterenkonia sp. GX14115]
MLNRSTRPLTRPARPLPRAITRSALVLGMGGLILSGAAPSAAAPILPPASEQMPEPEEALADRQADEAADETLVEDDVPEGVELEDAQRLIDESDEVTADDVRYAGAVDDLPEEPDRSFYDTPDQLPDEDGELIRQREGTFYLDPLNLVEPEGDVTTFMYRTTDSNEAARAATATLLEPEDGSGRVIVHAPGTQGMGDQCAPSRQLAAGTEYEGIGIANALNSGYTVVLVDYIGLGTEGEHTYLNRVDQGRAVLDAARAAAQVYGGGVEEDSPLHLRGYSQGGGAAASALELAGEHAPELPLVSGSAGAPPADLFRVAENIDGSLYSAFLLFAMGSMVESEGVDPTEFLNADGLQAMEEASGQCAIQAVFAHALTDSRTLTLDGRSFSEMIHEEPFASYLQEQSLGQQGRAPEVPTLINHAPLDDVIPYAVGRDMGSAWCGSGGQVTFEATGVPTHLGAYLGSMPRTGIFTARMFDGRSPVDSCWRL